MNRRGFLGFFGAGAVAAPKLAAGIADNVASGSMTVPIRPDGYATACSTDCDVDWKASRIKELKAIISGRDPDADRENQMNRLYAMEMGERLRLDSLRSVSPINKQRMLMASAPSRARRIKQADAKWGLKRLLAGN